MGRQSRAAHFWRVFSVTAWAMMLTMLGWEMPCMMDASKGSPSLMMIAAKSSMTCSKQTAVRPLVQGTEQASGVFAGPQQWPPKGDQAELPTAQQFGCKTPASHHSSSRGDAAADALQHRGTASGMPPVSGVLSKGPQSTAGAAPCADMLPETDG